MPHRPLTEFAVTVSRPCISSPCIKTCSIEPASGLCSGCGRSLAEIARWGTMSEAERLGIMAALPERRAALAPVPADPGKDTR